jgi:Type II secretion system (T2SS), protein E, N-terminal domain
MSTPLRERPDAPLGTLIFRAGLLPAETIENALEEGVKTGKRLGEILTERGLIKEVDLARLLAGQKGLTFVTMREQIVDPVAARLFTEDQARLFRALPFSFEDGKPVVAIADPTDEVLTRNVREALGREDTKFVVSARNELLELIGEVYAGGVPATGEATEPAPAADLQSAPVESEPESRFRVPAPDPEPESEPALEVRSGSDAEASPEPIAEVAPEPERVAEVTPEPEPVAAAEPEPVAEVAPEPEPVPEPPAEAPLPQPFTAVAAEPVAEAAPEPQPEPAAEAPLPQPIAEVAPHPELVPAAEAEPAPEAGPPVPEPIAEAAPEPVVEAPLSHPDASGGLTPGQVPTEPVSEPELNGAAHQNGSGSHEHVPVPASEPAPEPEPVTSPTTVPAAPPAPPSEVEAVAVEPLAPTDLTEGLTPEHVPTEPVFEPVAGLAPAAAAGQSYRVSIRLTNGERVEVGAYDDLETAKAQAKGLMAQVAAADTGDWPFVNGRFLKPDTIVSVDIA